MAVEWHPRQNARPTSWTLSNGRWGPVYGRIELVDVHRQMLWSSVYRAYLTLPGVTRDLGEFEHGDVAAIALWEAYLVESRGTPKSPT